MKLQKYETNMKAKIPELEEPTPSGVACTEIKCEGEMLWNEPRETHPEVTTIDRAKCGICDWLGWV